MKYFSRFRVLSIFFVAAFLLAARSGILAHAATLARGPQAEARSADSALVTTKGTSLRIDDSASLLSANDKSAMPEMHESEKPSVSSPVAASINEKEAFEKVETVTSFDDHESNSGGSNDGSSHDAGNDKSSGSGNSSDDGSNHDGNDDHGGSGNSSSGG